MKFLNLLFSANFKLILFSLIISNISIFAQSAAKNPIMKALEEEQIRAFEIFKKNGNPAPYFLSYQVTDVTSTAVTASFGALRNSDNSHTRNLDVKIRVGDFKLDNTNGRGGAVISQRLPIENDIDAIKSSIWLITDSAYKNAVDTFIRIKTQKDTTVEDEYPADNFSPHPPQISINQSVQISVKKEDWEVRLRKLSAIFKKYPEIYGGSVTFSADAINRYLVTSEGTSLQHGRALVRISIYASTKAEDGMDLFRFESFDALTPEGLPNDVKLEQAVEKVAKDVMALRKAPMIDPYDGPAILSGRASGVFFHEIFGHRIEGHRQKANFEGNTFTKRINQSVLPDFISVTDDPTLAKQGSIDLNGNYLFDEEGVKSQRVNLVENGILRNFLMSRSPIVGFPASNGHGRAAPGNSPVSRQGNLIISATKTVPNARLKQMLLEEVKKQGKTFGLFFEDISGGFTNTSRFSPQAFQVTPIMVYRIYADGRPDELVRGVDLIGTPLTSFSKIIAADDKSEVFNGFCGAESGYIPVSAISPSILIGQIEVQKRAKNNSLLPILPPPSAK
ncbi:MAG: metallopeptidase TldD-related protein [Acidobacteriota bacterium]